MHDRLQTLKQQWKNTYGNHAPPFPIMSPEAQTAIGNLYGHYGLGIPKAAINYLRQNPHTASQFDQKYGTNSAQEILGE